MSVLATDGVMGGTDGIDSTDGTNGIHGDITNGILGEDRVGTTGAIDGILGEDRAGIAGEDQDGTIGAGMATMAVQPITAGTIPTGTMNVTTLISGDREGWDPIRPLLLME